MSRENEKTPTRTGKNMLRKTDFSVIPFREIDDSLFLLSGIPDGAGCSTAFMSDIADHKVRSVDHMVIPLSDGGFEVGIRRTFTEFDFVIISKIFRFVFVNFRLRIRQDKDQRSASVAVFPDDPADAGRGQQVKVSLSPDQKFYIFSLSEQVSKQIAKAFFDFCRLFYDPMPEKTDCKISIDDSSLFFSYHYNAK